MTVQTVAGSTRTITLCEALKATDDIDPRRQGVDNDSPRTPHDNGVYEDV